MAAGTYSLDVNQISIQVTASTMMECPSGSLADEFIKDLNAAQSYLMDGEDLIIVLKVDAGSMRLQAPAPGSSASPTAEPSAPAVAETTAEPPTPAAIPTAETGGGEADILGVIWSWESATLPTGQPVTIDEPEQYQFMLLPTGTIRVKADCNKRKWRLLDRRSQHLDRGIDPHPSGLSARFALKRIRAAVEPGNLLPGGRGNLLLDTGGEGGAMEFSLPSNCTL